MAGANLTVGVNNSQFRNAMNEMNTQLKTVKSEFTLASTKAKLYGSNLDQLKVKKAELTKKIELNNQQMQLSKERISGAQAEMVNLSRKQSELTLKVEATSRAYKESVALTGKTSEESTKLKETLAKAEDQFKRNANAMQSKGKQITTLNTQLNTMETTLLETEHALEQVAQEITNLPLDALKSKLSDVGTSISSVGKKVTGVTIGIASAATAFTAGAFSMATGVGQTALEIQKFSDQVNLGVEEYQRLDQAMQISGWSMEQAAGDFSMLSEKIMASTEGKGEAYEMFRQLGVETTNLDGSLRNTGDVFNDTILALQNVTNETERSAIASILLGTTGEELSTILGMTNEEFINLKSNANVISEDEIAKAKQFNEDWMKVQNTFKTTSQEILIGLMPTFQTLLQVGSDVLTGVTPFIQDMAVKVQNAVSWFQGLDSEGQKNILMVAGLVAGIGPAITIVGGLVKGVGRAVDSYKAMRDGVNKVKLMLQAKDAQMLISKATTMAHTGATNVMAAAQGALNMVMSMNPIALVTIALVGLTAGIITLWNNCEWFRQGLLALWEGLKVTIGAAKDWILGKVEEFKVGFNTAMNLIKQMISNYFTVYRSIILGTMENIRSIVNSILTNIKNIFNAIWSSVSTLVTAQFNLIKNTITSVLNGIRGVVSNVLGLIKGIFTGDLNLIKSSVSGVFNSIKSTISNVMNGAKDIVKGAINKIISFFDFEWSLPKLKLPHFSIKGKFSLDPPSIPTIGVSWYHTGAIFKNRTILPGGIGVGDAYQGTGHNAEAIIPLDAMYREIATIIKREFDRREVKPATGELKVVIENFYNNTSQDIEELMREMEYYRKKVSY